MLYLYLESSLENIIIDNICIVVVTLWIVRDRIGILIFQKKEKKVLWTDILLDYGGLLCSCPLEIAEGKEKDMIDMITFSGDKIV